jgi:hypothetical protein
LVNSAGSSNAVVVFLAVMLGVVFTVFGLAILNAATAAAMVDLDAGRNTSAFAAYKKVLPKLGSILGVVLIRPSGGRPVLARVTRARACI